MLKIHRDNVDKFEWKILREETEYDLLAPKLLKYKKIMFVKKLDHISSTGQTVLRLFLNELMLAYECCKKNGVNSFSCAYKLFFEGLDQVSVECELKKTANLYNFVKKVQFFVNKGEQMRGLPTSVVDLCKKQGRCNIFKGHRDVLNSYYRHLFYTVKSVVDSNVFNDDEKIKYLKILRSQMTSEEQALLLFNWYAGYGTEWECKTDEIENHFFTKYKMIHNIEKKDIVFCFLNGFEDLKDEFSPKYINENAWKKMFEEKEREEKLRGAS